MISPFSDALTKLRRQFLDTLPTRLEAIRAEYCRVDLNAWNGDGLHHLVHGLVGAAGTFGFNSVSDAARKLAGRLEGLRQRGQVPSPAEWRAVGEAVEHLASMAQTDMAVPPVWPVTSSPSLTPRQPPAETAGNATPRPYRVLLVDDDLDTLELHASVLRAAGLDVRTLSEPLRVFEILYDFTPDVLLLDVHMPEASGPELAAMLREREAYVHTPILFLSAETERDQQLHALELGGDDFLVKPVDPVQLVSAVIGRARRARQIGAMRQRLEYTLYEREREHLALNQHAIVSIADRAGNITYANDKFCEVSGYHRDELIGKNHRVLKSGIHPPALYHELWHTISHGEVWQGELCNRRKDGTLYWVASTITPFVDSSGIPYQYVSIRTDITHVKAAETAIRASEARLNFLLSSSPVTIYTRAAQPPFRLTFVSQNAADVFGYAPAQVTDDPSFWVDRIHPADRSRVLDGLATLSEHALHQHEYRFLANDGSYRWVRDEARLIRDEGGNPAEMIGSWMDITKRRQAEEVAEEHKERLRRGQLYANIGTWDWNIATGELLWTERIAPLFGYPEGDLETSYENFLNAVHPDDRQAVIDAVNACVERDVPYEIEHRVVWPDGTVRWLLERGAVIRDADGKPMHMLGVVQDIDDRKRAQLVLAQREHDLREAQSLAHIGNWVADLRTGELTWSDEIYRIFGYEPGAFVPNVAAFHAAVHPDDSVLVKASETQAAQTGRHDVVHRIVRPDGSIRHVHELAQAEFDATGNMVRLSGTVQDVTEREETQARLRETEGRFAFAVEGAGDGVWDWNIQTGAMELSGNYEGMLGFEQGELQATIDAWVASVHPDDLARVKGVLDDYLTARSPVYAVELRLRCKDGGYKWILCRGTVVARDASGRPVRMIGIHSDISDRKAAEAALTAARDEADRANRAKSEFLSSMSHELRTSMNAILGFGQLMECDASLPEDHRDSVREILKAGHHLLELINEVLDLAKIESGHLTLALEPVEMGSVVEECVGLVQALAAQRGIRISHAGLDGVMVRADRMRLKQSLINLLSNAIKYNREGGSVLVSVEILTRDRLRIRVADTGDGIPAYRLPELFQPFHRLGAESSAIEGTGIGLTITRRLVEMMAGEVGVESELGVGSCFWIDLPLAASRRNALPEAVMPPEQATSSPDGDGVHTVLYIEDNVANTQLMEHVFAQRPLLRLRTAHAADAGLHLARSIRPALILLDLNIAGVDGYQVLEALRRDPNLSDIPVIAVTANAMPHDIARGHAAGFAGYMTKPIDIPQLLRMIDQCLGVTAERTA